MLRVGSLQRYEVHAFTTLLRHSGKYRLGARNSRLHKLMRAKSFHSVFQKKFVLECKPQRVSSDCAIFANTRSLVVEFGKGEEWLVLVGGISASYRKFSYARRNEQKSTQLTQRAGMSKNPHGGRRTGGFHTVTFSPRRNEQKSTRVGHRAGMSRFHVG